MSFEYLSLPVEDTGSLTFNMTVIGDLIVGAETGTTEMFPRVDRQKRGEKLITISKQRT